jgi:hypothetical protein
MGVGPTTEDLRRIAEFVGDDSNGLVRSQTPTDPESGRDRR